jgi:hypothetical protein
MPGKMGAMGACQKLHSAETFCVLSIHCFWLQVDGTLVVSPTLGSLDLHVGKLTVGAQGSFFVGSDAHPYPGRISILLNSSLAAASDSANLQPSIDVYGSLVLVGSPMLRSAMPLSGEEVAVTVDSVSKLQLRHGAAHLGLQAGSNVGVRSSAGHEIVEVAEMAEQSIMLAKKLALQHAGPVSIRALTRPIRLIADGTPAVLRVWNGAQSIARLNKHAGQHSDAARKRKARALPHAVARATIPTAASSCAGIPCHGGFVSSLAQRDLLGGVLKLVGVELAGFGAEGGAAVEVQDLMCSHRWPAMPKNVTILESTIWGSRGAGLSMQGCVAEMQVHVLANIRALLWCYLHAVFSLPSGNYAVCGSACLVGRLSLEPLGHGLAAYCYDVKPLSDVKSPVYGCLLAVTSALSIPVYR